MVKIENSKSEKLKILQDKVEKRLLRVNRKGMKELVEYMKQKGFFVSPSSTKFHGAYEGGLLLHCTKIYNLLKMLCDKLKIEVSDDTLIICSYLHDVCKTGAYIKQEVAGNSFIYKWNKSHPKGHAKLSVNIAEKFIELTPLEKVVISYHMGMYGTKEFSSWSGEYVMKDLVDNYSKEKFAKLFYFCDDMSSNFLE